MFIFAVSCYSSLMCSESRRPEAGSNEISTYALLKGELKDLNDTLSPYISNIASSYPYILQSKQKEFINSLDEIGEEINTAYDAAEINLPQKKNLDFDLHLTRMSIQLINMNIQQSFNNAIHKK